MKRRIFIITIIISFFLLNCEERDLPTLNETPFTSDKQKPVEFSCILPIEIQPKYEYGLDSLKRYLESFLPGFGRKCFSGNVFVKFTIDENGKASCLEIIRGFGEPYDSLILESLPEIPDFEPARMNDHPVKTSFILPLRYRF